MLFVLSFSALTISVARLTLPQNDLRAASWVPTGPPREELLGVSNKQNAWIRVYPSVI